MKTNMNMKRKEENEHQRAYDIDLYIDHIIGSGMIREELEWLINCALDNPNGLKKDLIDVIQEFVDIEIHGTDID